MRTYILFILLSLCIIGCKESSKKRDRANYTTYSISNMDVKPIEEGINNQYFTEPIFIKLKSKDINTDFGRISKIKLANDKIYILDQGIKSLIVYQKTGNAIGKVGRKGQGPNEYLDIADFDIDKENNIYTIDGRWDKLFIYNSDFSLRSSKKLPFEADKIQLLDNGNYMFALSSWNKGEGEGYRIAITDSSFNIIQTYLQYDKFIDENFWISDYQLTQTKDHIIYNKPIDNDIHLFTLNGELLKSVTLDFGKENVENEKKKNIEKYIREFNNYSLLKNFPVIYSDIIIGTLWEHRNSKVFLLDTKENILYKSKKFDDSDNSFYAGFCDSTIISFIHPDYYEESFDYHLLSEDQLEHLKNGDFILSLRHFR